MSHPERNTQHFLELLNRQNEAIAAQEAVKETPPPSVKPDPIRTERERKRREQFGPLRARGRMHKND